MNQQVANIQPRSVITDMATKFGMEREAFVSTLKATVVPANVSNEQFAAFLLVAKEYNLNPVIKELYAFPSRNGGIQPIVSIDGWMKIINSHPQFDGMEFEDSLDGSKLTAVTCRIFRKDRGHPIAVTEYMSECVRSTDTWKRWPARMLRHKAAIQCARYAFGFSGIVDPDEAERIHDAARDVTPTEPSPKALPALPDDTLQPILSAVQSGTATAEQAEAMLASKYTLTEGQTKALHDATVIDAAAADNFVTEYEAGEAQ